MSGVVVCVEADQIAVKDTQEQGLSDGKDSVDFTTREGRMQEEANLDVLLSCSDLLAQHFWQKHQVVVVDPDKIAILYILSHRFCEQPVDLLVCGPCRLVECDLSGVVMEEGPEDGI